MLTILSNLSKNVWLAIAGSTVAVAGAGAVVLSRKGKQKKVDAQTDKKSETQE